MKIVLGLLILILTASTGTGGVEKDVVITQWQCRGANIKHNNYIDANIDIDMDSLEVLWEREFPEIRKCWINNIVSDGERLFVNYYNIIECIDIDTGEEIWSNSYGMWESDFQSPILSVFNSSLYYAGHNNSRLFSINCETGDINWIRDADEDGVFAYTAPVVSEGRVVCNSGFSVTCIDEETGGIKWISEEASPSVYSTPVILGNRVFVANWVEIYTVSLTSGKLLNTQQTGGKGELLSQPRVYGDDIIVSTRCGYKQYNGETGDFVKEYILDEKCEYGPAEDDRFATNDKYKVLLNIDGYTCLDQNDEKMWTCSGKTPRQSGPIIIGDYIYIPEVERSGEKNSFNITKINMEIGNIIDKKTVVTVENDPQSEDLWRQHRYFSYCIFVSGKFFILADYTIFCVGMP
ncbi:MAG TPA: PQQ-binding-like beta-propeller repeat protein [Caldisericia bacterium]|nr:PQQ-binding-like beta-propeller repeat protein [Caldisericia bacterium]HPF49757.1 PQQ-binding-like beta-propeller repeat protein [Caldisericia bacterium]HPI84318.1 PQQ-binding-like beta-propeller repeat protein [Caldisericia bacterium]HPQ93745.1 PQQ-binding-like beta-propeller repeat protein [Caldisericia bacterium]HRV74831.1 PQQ-binding-like beta-propeller repeat protein [Caldisericia bacterium]